MPWTAPRTTHQAIDRASGDFPDCPAIARGGSGALLHRGIQSQLACFHHRADPRRRRVIAGRDCRGKPFPRHYLHDSIGRLARKTAVIRHKDWIRRSDLRDSPWGGGGEPVPVADVRSAAERSLADAILVSANYRQHGLPEGALPSDRPIAHSEVHLLLDGWPLYEINQQPVAAL